MSGVAVGGTGGSARGIRDCVCPAHRRIEIVAGDLAVLSVIWQSQVGRVTNERRGCRCAYAIGRRSDHHPVQLTEVDEAGENLVDAVHAQGAHAFLHGQFTQIIDGLVLLDGVPDAG